VEEEGSVLPDEAASMVDFLPTIYDDDDDDERRRNYHPPPILPASCTTRSVSLICLPTSLTTSR
jgi:hypothetical protein